MVERFDPTQGTEGNYVRYSDYADLERQIAELRAERDTLSMHLEARTILAEKPKRFSRSPATADGWRTNVVGWIVHNEMIPRALNSPGPVMTGPWFYPVEREQHAKDFARTLRADCLPLCVCPLPAAPTATGGR